jgi:hypothetical protein
LDYDFGAPGIGKTWPVELPPGHDFRFLAKSFAGNVVYVVLDPAKSFQSEENARD